MVCSSLNKVTDRVSMYNMHMLLNKIVSTELLGAHLQVYVSYYSQSIQRDIMMDHMG